MRDVWLIEIWDQKGKQWLPMAFDWYDEETAKVELANVRTMNKDHKARMMQYIPITQAANEVKRQQEFRAALQVGKSSSQEVSK